MISQNIFFGISPENDVGEQLSTHNIVEVFAQDGLRIIQFITEAVGRQAHEKHTFFNIKISSILRDERPHHRIPTLNDFETIKIVGTLMLLIESLDQLPHRVLIRIIHG